MDLAQMVAATKDHLGPSDHGLDGLYAILISLMDFNGGDFVSPICGGYHVSSMFGV